MKPELTSRERVRLALEHRETDRIPISMISAGICDSARRDLEAHLRGTLGMGVDAWLEPMIDVQYVDAPYIGPKLGPGEDIWGVVRKPISYGIGSYNEIHTYPLADARTPADLDRHRWPSPDWFDTDALPDLIRAAQADGERGVMITNGNIFERSWYMRGFERFFLDFVDNPELVHAIFERVTAFFVEYFRRMLAAGKGEIDLAGTADDIGGQRGLLMSPQTWETYLKPYHARLNAAIHEFDTRVIYHSDGAIMEAVPGLMEMGIDVLQALQFSADGMDPALLKDRFGDRLSFAGGVDVQKTFLLDNPDAVREEVEHLIRTLGRNGGYILGPSHAIQDGTPPENIVAAFDTAAHYYPYQKA